MLSAGQSVQKYFYTTVGPERVYTPPTKFQCAPLVVGDVLKTRYCLILVLQFWCLIQQAIYYMLCVIYKLFVLSLTEFKWDRCLQQKYLSFENFWGQLPLATLLRKQIYTVATNKGIFCNNSEIHTDFKAIICREQSETLATGNCK